MGDRRRVRPAASASNGPPLAVGEQTPQQPFAYSPLEPWHLPAIPQFAVRPALERRLTVRQRESPLVEQRRSLLALRHEPEPRLILGRDRHLESAPQRMRQQPASAVVTVSHQSAFGIRRVLAADDFTLAEFHSASMRDRSRISKSCFHPFAVAQRASAAFRALRFRCAAVSFRARAFPPFSPPSRPRATAAAFFFDFAMPD